jgi:hypothetical protein
VFTSAEVRIHYEITKQAGGPVGEGQLGDLHFDTSSETPWVRTEVGWTIVDLSRQSNGLPSQTHLIATYEHCLSVSDKDWKSRNYWYTGGGATYFCIACSGADPNTFFQVEMKDLHG